MLRRRRAQVALAETAPDGNPADNFAGDGLEPFGPYRLIEKIGEGGMAEVFTAIEAGKRGPLVVKRLRQELSENPIAVGHFLEEGAIVRGLRHPNIVGVRDFGAIAGRHYIAGEYVPGRDLGRLTRRMVELKQRPLSAAAILYIAHEVLSGLEYAHHRPRSEGRTHDLVHRDITPENVMLTPEGQVKLLDFGISCQAEAGEADGIKGNVDFMSPEQARGKVVDRRSDLFSLGLVIYFCAARAPLYRGKTIYDRLLAAATGPTPAEDAFVAGLPPPLADLLPSALAVEPRLRYQTAAEMRAAIAPHIERGAAEVAETVRRVFGGELAQERARLGEGEAAQGRAFGAQWQGRAGEAVGRPG